MHTEYTSCGKMKIASGTIKGDLPNLCNFLRKEKLISLKFSQVGWGKYH
jgi:hypothetical protein